MRSIIRAALFMLITTACLALAACGGGSSSGGGGIGSAPAGYATIKVYLTDAPTDEVKAVYVTVASVAVHLADTDQWQTVATPGAAYNLLELTGGNLEELGISHLPAGQYTQVRLLLSTTPVGSHPFANYVIDLADQAQELKVPSGSQSGIKIVKSFTIAEGQTYTLVLDFIAAQSLKKTGNGKWMLQPTIKALVQPGG